MDVSDERLAVEARALGRAFGRQTVLRDIDLSVREGEIFGILGPDGAGKTTLMQILAGILDPTRGACTTLGFDTVREAGAIASRIGYMAQGFTLYGSLSVDENLAFAARIRAVEGEAFRQRKNRLLAMAGLTRFGGRRADRLSGGMQKKLALCTNLIHEPALLLLDELSLGVDPLSRRELWEMLRRFRESGTTIVLTTPYLDEAEHCDRVSLMSDGSVLAADSPDALRRLADGQVFEWRPDHPAAALPLLDDVPGLVDVHPRTDRIRFMLATEFPLEEHRRRILAGRGELRSVDPTLEDVFIALTSATESRVGTPATSVGPFAAINRAGPAVHVQDLTCRFGTFVAVDRVSFDVAPGEVFAFLGPNGAGKTTAIRALCGLLRPTAGRVEVAGIDVRRQPRQLRPRIGYMSQRFSLYPDLTVAENLAFFAGAYALRGPRKSAAIRRATGRVGLDGWEAHEAGRLSGALRQRLALACAVLHAPAVLFLDEPTSGVDPLARRRFWQLIQSLTGDGVAVLVTTHYLEEAEYCDRLGLMDRGRLIASGTQSELRAGLGGEAGAMEDLFIGYIRRSRREEEVA